MVLISLASAVLSRGAGSFFQFRLRTTSFLVGCTRIPHTRQTDFRSFTPIRPLSYLNFCIDTSHKPARNLRVFTNVLYYDLIDECCSEESSRQEKRPKLIIITQNP